MRKHFLNYENKLESEIIDCMKMPLSDRTADRVDTFLKYWLTVCEAYEKASSMLSDRLTEEEIKDWNARMENDDGTFGGHWRADQTEQAAKSQEVKFEHITGLEWNVTMNMMYSDYCEVAKTFGMNTPDFYAFMAKKFLFDKDGGTPSKKLAAYYHCIAERK